MHPISNLTPQARLIIVCGLPGSGKTAHARQVEQELPAIRFCPDEWMDAPGINLWDSEVRQRIENLQWDFAQQILRHGGSVVIEWGTWGRSERDTLRMGAEKLGAVVELHFLDVPIEVLFKRIKHRNAETPEITFEDIKAWSEKFERPSFEELALYDRSSTQQAFDEPVEGS